VTGSPIDRADSSAPAIVGNARRPAVFTTGITSLGVSAAAYGLADGSSLNYEPATTTYMTTPIWWLLYVWFVIRVARARRSARTAVTVLAVVNGIMTPAMAYGPEGVAAYFIGLVTSAAGVVLLYLPESKSYVGMRQAGPSASDVERQVRQLFDKRGKDGKRIYTVADIAARLGMSRSTVYRHLDADQQRQVRRPEDER
jgi:DNA-binding transcriptional ArsR family regulator